MIDIRQVADAAGVHHNTVRRAIALGVIRPAAWRGNKYLFCPPDVDALREWLAQPRQGRARRNR